MDHSESLFTKQLEVRARRLISQRDGNSDQSTIIKGMLREIALTIEQLDTLRELDEKLGRSLLRVECYTDTELMQMEARTPRYSPERFPEREKLQRRLLDIEKERRRFQITQLSEHHKLQQRLIELLNKFDQLSI